MLRLWNWFISVVGKINWNFIAKALNGKYYNLDIVSQSRLRYLLVRNHYIILTRRRTHLSTYLIGLSDLLLRGKFGFWSHCAMNTEDEVNNNDDFRIIEAIGTGVKYSTFLEVFDCDAAALLTPKGFTPEEWDAALFDAAAQIGKPYDTVFNVLDDSKLSCIELIRHALKSACKEYDVEFAAFEKLLKRCKTITPSMLYDCGDFLITYEVRR